MRVLHWDGERTAVIATDVELADSVLSKVCGLMFREPLSPGDALVFRFNRARSRSIHTFFLRAGIDVIWTTDEVVTRVDSLDPWSYSAGAKCDTIIELPSGTASAVDLGDHVRLRS